MQSPAAASSSSSISPCFICEPVSPPPPDPLEVDDYSRLYPVAVQTRAVLPAPLPHILAVLSLVLQDLRESYSIPYVPTPLVNLIAEYAADASGSIVHGSVVTLSSQFTALDCWRRTEFHSAQQIRACVALEDESATRRQLAAIYLSLTGDEMRTFRDQHSIPSSLLAFEDLQQDVETLRKHFRNADECTISEDTQRRAANRMAELLVTTARIPEDERTPEQQKVWVDCEVQRDFLLQRLQERTIKAKAPLGQVIERYLKEIGGSADSLFTLSEFSTLSGELVSTTRMAAKYPAADENEIEKQDRKAALGGMPACFDDSFTAAHRHEASHLQPLSKQEEAMYRSMDSPPF